MKDYYTPLKNLLEKHFPAQVHKLDAMKDNDVEVIKMYNTWKRAAEDKLQERQEAAVGVDESKYDTEETTQQTIDRLKARIKDPKDGMNVSFLVQKIKKLEKSLNKATENKSQEVARGIHTAINNVDESLHYRDFAKAVAITLKENYGTHNIAPFMKVLHAGLGMNEPLNEATFKKGDKVTYLGHPAKVTATKEYNGRNFVSVSYNKGTGETKASDILTTSGDVKAINEDVLKHIVKHSKSNNTYQVWLGDKIVTDFATKERADAKAKRLNALQNVNEAKATCCHRCGRVHVKGTPCKKPYLKGKDSCAINEIETLKEFYNK